MNSSPALPPLPERTPESHKGTFGRCLLIGGSRGMSGSISLAGTSALRSGAGLVTLAVPATILPTVAATSPCYMTLPLPDNATGECSTSIDVRALTNSRQFDAIGCGPGIGTGKGASQTTQQLYHHATEPTVFDADSLNVLAAEKVDLRQSSGPRIITPHIGEFRRLTGRTSATVAELRDLAPEWAQQNQVTLVLKGHQTIVTDGQQLCRNTTGNAGMATGGSGDVLTGTTASFLAQGLTAFDAARLAAYVHGRSGDIAAEQLGMVSLIATDIIDYLPNALRELGEAS